MTTTTTLLEQQITTLLRQLKETKEAERLEAVRKEAEPAVEKARLEEEQRRLQAEAERVRHDVEERCIEQERREQEEEAEAHRRKSHLESTLTLVAAPEGKLVTKKFLHRYLHSPPNRRGIGACICDACQSLSPGFPRSHTPVLRRE